MILDEENNLGDTSQSNSGTATASITRTMHIAATADAIWLLIGGFSSINDWHPAIGTYVDDGRQPPTRTLVTNDGSATFVETMTGRSEPLRSYSYNFVSAPLPLSNYLATIRVVAKDAASATVIWTGSYDPDPGQEAECLRALAGIYETGLLAIKARFADGS